MCKSCKEQTEALLNEIDGLKEKLERYEEKILVFESATSDVVRLFLILILNAYLISNLIISRGSIGCKIKNENYWKHAPQFSSRHFTKPRDL